MEPDDRIEDRDDFPDYRDPQDIDGLELSKALRTLHLLGGDPYLRMQAFNLSIVDQFIMKLEYDTLRELNDEESTPMPEATFLSAQSQMWIFAAYEILRTWRARATDVIKWHKNGALKLKIGALEKELGYVHPGRKMRANQLRQVLDDPTIIDKIKSDLRIVHIPFARIEYVRVALAKHEIRGNKSSVAYAPGYGRINRWCGSLDYELESDGAILGVISRRDIADDLRAISDRSNLPTDEAIASFDMFMKGPRTNPF
jgi:hypothetical protein